MASRNTHSAYMCFATDPLLSERKLTTATFKSTFNYLRSEIRRRIHAAGGNTCLNFYVTYNPKVTHRVSNTYNKHSFSSLTEQSGSEWLHITLIQGYTRILYVLVACTKPCTHLPASNRTLPVNDYNDIFVMFAHSGPHTPHTYAS